MTGRTGDGGPDEPTVPDATPEDATPEDATPADATPEDATTGSTPAVLPQRRRTAGVVIGVLVALLGFGIAVQVKSNAAGDSLTTARESDLISILDDQNSRADRLSQQISQLSSLEQQLKAGGDRDTVARQQAQQESQDLAILLGTIPATGPGVQIQVLDPQKGLKAADLLDVIEELRGAGAEAIQFGPVRVSTQTAVVDGPSPGTVVIDGQTLQAPYTVLAIGDPSTLQTALDIPGGPAAVARNVGGDAVVDQRPQLTITAVRALARPSYATPTSR